MKTKILLSSAMVIAVCICLIAGSTFALFTTTTTVNIAVTAGNLDVSANFVQGSIETKSMTDREYAPSTFDAETGFITVPFDNGGTAKFEEKSVGQDKVMFLNIDNMTPGDAVKFKVEVKNEGDVAVQYTVKMAKPADFEKLSQNVKDFYEHLEIIISDENGKVFGKDQDFSDIGTAGETTTFTVEVKFPDGDQSGAQNKYQQVVTEINFVVEAVQQNAVNNGSIVVPTTP